MPLAFVGTTLMLLVIRPSMNDTRVVLLTSAGGCVMLLAYGLGALVTGVSRFVRVLSARDSPFHYTKLDEESSRIGDIRMQSEFATSVAYFVFCLLLGLPLLRNVITIQCKSGPSPGIARRRLSRLWLVWRGGNTAYAFANFAFLAASHILDSSAYSGGYTPYSFMPGDYYRLPQERAAFASMGAVCILCACLPTRRARMRFALRSLKSRPTSATVAGTTRWLRTSMPRSIDAQPYQASAGPTGFPQPHAQGVPLDASLATISLNAATAQPSHNGISVPEPSVGWNDNTAKWTAGAGWLEWHEPAVGSNGMTAQSAQANQPSAGPTGFQQPSAQGIPLEASPPCQVQWTERPAGLAKEITLARDAPILGYGGFGVVFAAEWRGQRVAAKQLHNTSPSNLRLFRREAELLTTLEGHRHLCACIGSCLLEGKPAIILDLHEGGALEKALGIDHESNGASASDASASAAPPTAQTDTVSSLPRPSRAIAAPLRRFDARWQLGIQLASALAHLHHHQILHRDIKPANVLLDGTMRHAVLCDFGIARRISVTPSNDEGGTWRYMAPETVWERYSAAADVYSFALLLWSLAYAKKCFGDFKCMQLVMLMQDNPYTVRPPLSPPPCTDADPEAPHTVEMTANRWEEIKTLLQDCWHGDAARRPVMKDVVQYRGMAVGL